MGRGFKSLHCHFFFRGLGYLAICDFLRHPNRVISFTLLAVLFLAGLAGGLIALPMKSSKAKTSWLCLGGTFAGGAFLATAFFELGPESVESLGPWGGFGAIVFTMGFLFWLDRQGHHAHAEMHGCHPHGGEATLAKPWILGGMLGFHSLLEGLALGSVSAGAAQDALALAILFHKATDTFALAVTLSRYGFSGGKIILATVLLSLASPGGAWLASGVNVGDLEILHGIFASATCGTFLYLAGSDLLIPELREREGRRWKGLAAAVGFGAVAAAIFLGHG